MIWNKGLTKETSVIIRNATIKRKTYVVSQETKLKMSIARKKLYEEGKIVSPFKNNPKLWKIIAGKNKGKHYNKNNWCKGLTKNTHPSLMKMSKKLEGIPRLDISKDKSFHWKGGISKKGYSFRFNENIKRLVRAKYDFNCIICGKNEISLGKNLDCHHIDLNRLNNKISNLVTLCRTCHTKEEKSIEFFKKIKKIELFFNCAKKFINQNQFTIKQIFHENFAKRFVKQIKQQCEIEYNQF